MPKQPTCISLTVDQRRQIDEEREKRARDGEKPSVAAVVREFVSDGLNRARRGSQPPPSTRTA